MNLNTEFLLLKLKLFNILLLYMLYKQTTGREADIRLPENFRPQAGLECKQFRFTFYLAIFYYLIIKFTVAFLLHPYTCSSKARGLRSCLHRIIADYFAYVFCYTRGVEQTRDKFFTSCDVNPFSFILEHTIHLTTWCFVFVYIKEEAQNITEVFLLNVFISFSIS
jgi:hypothetical protein